MNYSNLFFDLDDTIWDTATNGKESLEEVYREYNFDRFFLSFENFYSIYLPNNNDLWAKYALGKISKEELIYKRFYNPLHQYGITDRDYILHINDDFLDRTTRKTKLIPHAIEILSYLKPNYRIFVLSNGFNEVQFKKINNSGLAPYFDSIILSEEIGINKPKPEIFRYALNKTGSERKSSVMIGDNWSTDIEGAKNCGIDQIWFNPANNKNTDFTPTYVINSLLELKAIL